MRMHEVAKHKIMHIVHTYMAATICQCCMWEYHIKQRAIAHFKTTKRCLPLLRYYAPEGIGLWQNGCKRKTAHAPES